MNLKKLSSLVALSMLGCAEPSDTGFVDSANSFMDRFTPYEQLGIEKKDNDLSYSIEQTGPLSYRVNFSTEDKLFGRVRYAEKGTNKWHYIQDGETGGTEHTIDVVGLGLNREYDVSIETINDNGETIESDTLEIKTEDIMPVVDDGDRLEKVQFHVEVDFPRPDLAEENVVYLATIQFGPDGNAPYAVIFDRTGNIIWGHFTSDKNAGSTGDMSIQLLGEGEGGYLRNNSGRSMLLGGGIPLDVRVQEVEFGHDVTKELTKQGQFCSDNFMHHDYKKLDSGNYLTVTSNFDGGLASDLVVLHDGNYDPEVNKDNPDESVIWKMRMADFTQGDMRYFSNTSFYDDETNTLFYNQEHAEAPIIYAFNPENTAKKWLFGEGISNYDWPPSVTLVDHFTDTGKRKDPWPYNPHDVHFDYQGEGIWRILEHDNGIGTNGPRREYTSVAEFEVDSVQGDARVLWSYPNDEDFSGDDPAWFYSNYGYGGIQRVGENVVFGGGSVWPDNYTDPQSTPATVIQEVRPNEETHDATLVWRMRITTDNPEIYHGFYKVVPVKDLRGLEYDEREEIPAHSSQTIYFSSLADYDYWDF